MKILVIDDHSIVRTMVRRLMDGTGHHFVEAGASDEALAILAQDPDIRLVLCDYMMPGINGLDFVTALRKISHHNATPIVMLSATRNKDIIEEGQRRGVANWLTKPFTRDQLAQAIAELEKSA
jgi:CheY-like chemotaxis protein